MSRHMTSERTTHPLWSSALQLAIDHDDIAIECHVPSINQLSTVQRGGPQRMGPVSHPGYHH